jgi:tetratricopeptide (TPR) repeat protein
VRCFAEPDSRIAESLTEIGRWYGEQGDIESALTYSEQALAMRRELFSEPHPEIAHSLFHIGRWQGEQGNERVALDLFKQSTAMLRELFGERHPGIAASLVNIGRLYRKQGNLERALDYLEQGLTTNIEIYGERHSYSARTAESVAITLIMADRREDAYNLVSRFLKLSLHSSQRERLKGIEAELLQRPFGPALGNKPRPESAGRRRSADSHCELTGS